MDEDILGQLQLQTGGRRERVGEVGQDVQLTPHLTLLEHGAHRHVAEGGAETSF